MRVISLGKLQAFWRRHPDVEQPLRAWYSEVNNENWESPADVKAKYGSASIIGGKRVVFNIKGNRYRLVVEVNYDFGIVLVKFLGTHEEYDRIDSKKV